MENNYYFICEKCGYKSEHLGGEWSTTASNRTDIFGFKNDFTSTHDNCGGKAIFRR